MVTMRQNPSPAAGASAGASPAQNDARKAKLNQLFHAVIFGERALKSSKDGDLFIEALCAQSDPPTCIGKLASSAQGMRALQESMRFNVSAKFLDGSATSLLKYLQDAELKKICGGDFLQQAVLQIVDPPFFWDAFVTALKEDRLGVDTQHCFGWLLLELISLPDEKAATYYPIAADKGVQTRLLNSPRFDTRILGQRIKHVLCSLTSKDMYDDEEGYGPGGRHDNDKADYREVSVLPTADELTSTEPPYLCTAQAIEDPKTVDKRVAIHLSNQFRLLREDMIGEMREELMIARGEKKGRHRGMVVDGFELVGIDCGDPPSKVLPWSVMFKCAHDLPQLRKVKPNSRRKFLEENIKIFKHQSLACLIVDGEIVAFPSINRNLDMLAKNPPVLLLQLSGEASTSKAFLKLKTAKSIKLIQIDTAVFSFEPILKRLQEMKELPLSEELLRWSKGNPVDEPPSLPMSILKIVDDIEDDPGRDLQSILRLEKSVKLDDSQSSSLVMGLTQTVSLIQGPPGTGKSFIGALIGKALHDNTNKKILVVTYTNHALDQFLEDLMDIGIPGNTMVRLGGKSTPRTKPLALLEQSSSVKLDQYAWRALKESKSEATVLGARLQAQFGQYKNASIGDEQILQHLEFASEDLAFDQAFELPESEDGMTWVDRKGKPIRKSYLLKRWIDGQDAGIFNEYVSIDEDVAKVWAMPRAARHAALTRWRFEIIKEQVSNLYTIAEEYAECQKKHDRLRSEKNATLIKTKRIIGCTTTAAAKYAQELLAASAEVVLVEEAGEILESHILTALGTNTQQLILIGDHKQLRPKINNYQLSVEKGEGYDLNRSLFERLVLKGFPHRTLLQQHRMRPEISALVRELTYPDLVDAPGTKNRDNLRGFQSNVVFVNHSNPEDDNQELANINPGMMTSSKQNQFEVDMVLKCVRYLGQQGYGTDKLVILTPYLGQLHLLKRKLSKDNDPVLNDLDSYDLVRFGLMPAASAQIAKRPIYISSIDNYQGEERDIVIVTMTRSNPEHDIGFMAAPERLNVLLSRARIGLIMIGNAETFINARRGKEVWTKFFGLLKASGNIYDGFPVKCERHPDRKAILLRDVDFDDECPDGGCKEPCGTMLSCNVHTCPQKCHQIYDHSKMTCHALLRQNCPSGHPQQWKCHQGPPASCRKCEDEKRRAEEKQQKEFDLQQKRDAEIRDHQRAMAALDEKIEKERQVLKDAQAKRERERAYELKQKELEEASAIVRQASQQSPWFGRLRRRLSASASPGDGGAAPPEAGTAESSRTPRPDPSTSGNDPGGDGARNAGLDRARGGAEAKPFPKYQSAAEDEWARQKDVDNAQNAAIDSLMDMIGLEDVKEQVLKIKAKVDMTVRQGTSLQDERFGVSLLGNPGTGKTTVARLYAKFLTTVGVLPGTKFIETTGSRLANDGVPGVKKHIEDILKEGGGALFVDEAYQLTDSHNVGGASVLDFLLAEIENNVGKILFIVAGYRKQMEKFFEHNPGLSSRIPYTLHFADYQDGALLEMLKKLIDKKYGGRMKAEGGLDGLYMRVAIRRLGRSRGRDGFGNARALQNIFSQITERQAERLARERKAGLLPDDFFFTQEDLIGPDPSKAIVESKAFRELEELIGLGTVKDAARALVDLIITNYRRELAEKPPMEMCLNRVCLGNPGTGKTTVGRLYGRILADLGLLSNGEVVEKNPSDFIGSVMGESEANTKSILASTVGKVLIIDEAYMLYSGGLGSSGGQNDMYKTAVIDTIVAEVQSVPGDDRCVLMLGYEDQIKEMFQNVNPGLSRRFAIEDAFRFQDFTAKELAAVLDMKLKKQGVEATDEAKAVAAEVLGRARRRPNFGNGGEVENVLGKAKVNFQKRQSKKPLDQREIDVVFQPQDFDPDFDRGKNAALNCRELFKDVIGCEAIVEKLEGYQQIAANMKAAGLDPHEEIPTNFVFKGPPGTGKTTTARKMGQVFYDMGFLSTTEVDECSATDLIGQYVGQTGPKLQKRLEKALGKVLFVDEAYRLGDNGHFAKEAVDELVDCVTKPKFHGKMVIILAGYDHDMNRLMSVNSGLSSRFPEEIVFENMAPEYCLQLLEKDLSKKNIPCPALQKPESAEYKTMITLLESCARLPDWGNARDVKTMGKKLIGHVFKGKSRSKTLSSEGIIDIMKQFLAEKQSRAADQPSYGHQNSRGLSPADKTSQLQVGQPPPTPTRTTKKTNVRLPPPKAKDPPPVAERAEEAQPTVDDHERDPGVSDAAWRQLQADKLAAERRITAAREAELEQEREAEKQRAEAEAREKEKKALAERLARASEEREKNELKRKLEEQRIAELNARIAYEKAMAERERLRREEEERRRLEAKAQSKLRQMGVCPVGFKWIKQASGYKCAGGSHYVSNSELGL